MTHLATDQEVFETPDYPEETYNYTEDHKTSAIQKLDVNVKSSYGKFKDKILDGRDIDFSDSVSRPLQSGFKVQPSEFGGVSCDRDAETVMERYLRLKEEVGALVSDVQQIQDMQENAEKLLQVSPADLLKDVQLMQKQLHGLQLDRVLGTDMQVSAEHPYQAILARDLTAQVQALGTQGEGEGEGGVAGGRGVYEVYTRTEAAKFAHLSKLGEVERRLTQLEALVGGEEMTVSSVAGGQDSKDKDLSSAVLNLQAKVALLDPDHVATVGAQLQGVLALMDRVDEQAKPKSEDLEKSAKVAEALEMVGRLVGVVPLIPDLVERLHALRELHERAAQFAGSVAYISDSQDQLGKETRELRQLLSQVQESLQSNMSTLQSEFADLGSRIKSLKTKS